MAREIFMLPIKNAVTDLFADDGGHSIFGTDIDEKRSITDDNKIEYQVKGSTGCMAISLDIPTVIKTYGYNTWEHVIMDHEDYIQMWNE